MTEPSKTNQELLEETAILKQRIQEREHAESELKRAEEALWQTEEKYRLIAENSADMISILDMNLRFTYVSPASMRLLGYTVEEAMEQTLDQILTPESMRLGLTVFEKEMQLEASGTADPDRTRILELEEYKKDGSIIWVEVSFSFLRDKDRKPVEILMVSRDITDRKRVEEKLRLITDNMSDMIRVTDLQGANLYVSPSHEKILGYKPEERVGKTGFDIIHPDDMEHLIAVFSEGIINKRPGRVEYRIKHAEGHYVWLETIADGIMDDKGEVTAVIQSSRDITHRKRIEETLLESEEKYRVLFEGINDAVFVHDLDQEGLPGRFLQVNNVACSRLGYTRDELLSLTPRDITTSEEYKRIANKRVVLASQGDILAETVHVTKDGRSIPVESNIRQFKYFGKQVALSISRDITLRKQAEEKLLESTENFRRSLDGSPMGVRIVTAEGVTVYANRAILDIHGYDNIEELKTTPVEKRYTPESYAEFQIRRDKRKRGDYGPFEYEISIIRKDGAIRHLHVFRKEVLWDAERQFQVMYQDITERKRAEDELYRVNMFLNSIIENIPDTIFLKDAKELRFVLLNRAGEELTGYSCTELMGKNDYDFVQKEQADFFKDKDQAALRGKEVVDIPEESLQTRNKGMRTLHTKKVPILNANGDPEYLLGISEDITDRKQMEEELLRAHKLESLGVLAGGIAHDFNNLMAIVQGYIDLALMDLPPDHISHKRLLTAMRSVDQTKDLTSRLITFSRGGGPNREILDVAELVRDAVLRTIKATEIRAKFAFAENLWPSKADKLQMKQVFYNLSTNAMEAMPKGGNLLIQGENALVHDGEVLELKEGSYLKITFDDDGIGIHEEHLSKIFDPYFTTKKMATQKGLGLGLAVCYSVLKNHNGHITVKSRSGEGASFILYLPARADLAKEKEVKATLSTGTFRVLIMDDESHIRVIERVYLERMGYEVTDAKDGQEAIDTYREAFHSGTPFDLVMLDLTVRQGMGGHMAMELLLKIDPSIRAVIASGFVDDPVIENYEDYGFQGALKKPFKREEIESLLVKILHR
ncbi:MAG: PAS domain S-box protein [Syntrophus sp. (in: bacteria)]